MRLWFLVVFALFSFLTAHVRADWISDPKRGQVGWYGYEPLKEEKEEKGKQVEKATPPLKIQAPELPSSEPQSETQGEPVAEAQPCWPTPDELYHMRTKEIRDWLERAADEALTNPTEENIKRWVLYFQVVNRKALEFAGAWRWVMQTNPDLAKPAALYPATNPGSLAFWKTVWNEINRVLSETSDRYALLFLKGNDFFSEAMKLVISGFQKDHPSWIVKTVDVTREPEVADRLGVTYTPQVWLIAKGKEKPIPLAGGVISKLSLEKRIYHTILVLEGQKTKQLAPYYPFFISEPFQEGKEGP